MPVRRKTKPEDEIAVTLPDQIAVTLPDQGGAAPDIVAAAEAPPVAVSSPAGAPATTDAVETTPATGFELLGLIPTLLQAVRDAGFEEPTPIQRRTIPLLLEGRDVVAQAQTGTGKTAAFALPLLQRLDLDDRSVQCLVLTPTRELAVQVAAATHALGRLLEIQVLPIYGGQPIERQLRALRSGVQVVIGTPGRVLDHLRRGSLNVAHVRTLVLDEADEMLDMGFEEELEAILAELPAERQSALFSATIPARILRLSRSYLKDPVRVAIESERLTVPQVQQTYYEVTVAAKMDSLTRILDMETPGSGIIFCRTKRMVDEVGEALMARGYPAETLHGDLSQAMRDRVMRRFREGQIELLVATDVAARGLDIEQVSHVINYDIPEDPEQYIHRIGRTARAGRSGDAITLVTPREMRLLHEIERLIRQRIQPARVPTAGDIAARRLELTKDAITHAIEEGGLEPYLLAVENLAANGDIAQIAAAALRLVLERDGSNSRTMIAALGGEAALGVETGMQRLFIDLGRKQGIRPGDIVGAITNEAGIAGTDIGVIDIYDNFAFVEVSQKLVERVVNALQNASLHGKEFTIDIARPREEQDQPSIREGEQEARSQRPATSAPARRPVKPSFEAEQEPGFESEESEEDEDSEPPSRPANWREDVRPRSAYSGGPPRQRVQQGRPNTGNRTREGFGPFRGPEPRESPPWQRRRAQGEHGNFGGRGGDTRGTESSFRPQRSDGPPFPAPPRRNPEPNPAPPRPQDQANHRAPRDTDTRRQRRRDTTGGENGRRFPSGPPPQRPRRPRDTE